MATPTLQDVLDAVPAVAELVDQMTELLPGVPANEQNLQTLWTYLQGVVYREYASGELLVVLQLASKKKGVYQYCHVQVMGKPVDCRRRDGSNFPLRPLICEETHRNTSEGLLQCLIFARQTLYRYGIEGACPSCCSVIGPVRKLKAVGMPRCADCMLTGVIAMAPEAATRATLQTLAKRARISRE